MDESTTSMELVLPRSATTQSPLFAIDIGVETIKVGFVPRKRSNQDPDKASIKLDLFNTNELEKSLAYVAEKADLTQKSTASKIHGCGRGLTNEVKSLIETEFSCELVHMEEDCLGKTGLKFLLNSIPHDEIFYPPCYDGVAKGKMFSEVHRSIKKKFLQSKKNTGSKKEEEKTEEEESAAHKPVYIERKEGDQMMPALLINMGGNFRTQKVSDTEGIEEDHMVLTPVAMGGMFFHGVCGFFAGTKDYNELIKMVDESNGETVETTFANFKAVQPKSGKESIYNLDINLADEAEKEMRIFIMDKMVSGNPEDAKLGDGVHSLLKTVCENIVSHALNLSDMLNVPKIIFSGSFIHPKKVREWITMISVWKNSNLIDKGKEPTQMEFLQHGSFLPVIGAFTQDSSFKKTTL